MLKASKNIWKISKRGENICFLPITFVNCYLRYEMKIKVFFQWKMRKNLLKTPNSPFSHEIRIKKRLFLGIQTNRTTRLRKRSS